MFQCLSFSGTESQNGLVSKDILAKLDYYINNVTNVVIAVDVIVDVVVMQRRVTVSKLTDRQNEYTEKTTGLCWWSGREPYLSAICLVSISDSLCL